MGFDGKFIYAELDWTTLEAFPSAASYDVVSARCVGALSPLVVGQLITYTCPPFSQHLSPSPQTTPLPITHVAHHALLKGRRARYKHHQSPQREHAPRVCPAMPRHPCFSPQHHYTAHTDSGQCQLLTTRPCRLIQPLRATAVIPGPLW